MVAHDCNFRSLGSDTLFWCPSSGVREQHALLVLYRHTCRPDTHTRAIELETTEAEGTQTLPTSGPWQSESHLGSLSSWNYMCSLYLRLWAKPDVKGGLEFPDVLHGEHAPQEASSYICLKEPHSLHYWLSSRRNWRARLGDVWQGPCECIACRVFYL